MYRSTIFLVILFLVLAVIGIIFHARLYPEGDLSATFLANDIVNLLLGLPMLSISIIQSRRQKLVGLLCYPGALFYMIYVYATYLLGLPFNVLSIPYLLLISLSIYILLLVIALLILMYQCYSIILSLIQNTGQDQLKIAQWIVDSIIQTPPALIISISMVRQKALGHVPGMSLLFLLSALFVGLIPFMIIKGILTGAQINGLDILIVSLSSLIGVVPLILYERGLRRKQEKH